MQVKERIEKLRKELPGSVNILLATKKRSTQKIKEAIDSKIKYLGENYVQEAQEKYNSINRKKAELWFIGHLQKNKINKAIKIFDTINIDSEKIAKAISKRTQKEIKITIEVNISGENQKQGCKKEDLINLIENISQLKNIKIIGLMAMAPYFEDKEKTRPYFKEMKILFEKAKKINKDIKILSIGMSGDYQVAVEEGSNMIRVGSMIFN